MNVTGGSTDVTTYFSLRLSATGAEATGLTISDMDLQYVRTGAVPVAKVDAVALAATDTAHTDNRGIEIDATDQPGLYRIDWPDAAFAAGVREVILTVKCATAFTEHLRVSIELAAPFVTLADGVAHGGSTASLILNYLGVFGTAGPVVEIESSSSGEAIYINGAGKGIAVFSGGGPAIEMNSTNGHCIEMSTFGTDMNGINITTTDGHGVNIAAVGSGKHDINLAGSGDIVGKLVANALDDIVVESGLNARQALSLIASALTGILSGAETTTITIKGAGVATTRILATVDVDGNRSALTLTPPA